MAKILVVDDEVPVQEHDGIWLVEQVMRKWPDTQVIVVTASDEAGLEARTRQAGASDYVPKPVDRANLYQALQRAIARVEFRN